MCKHPVMQIQPTESTKQPPLWKDKHFEHRVIRLACCSIAVLGLLTSCAKPLDMSGESITPPGPERGVVIGSVLVRPEKGSSDTNDPIREPSQAVSAEAVYEFDIVPIQPGDPEGASPYGEKYRIHAKLGEERTFVSRLKSGQYLIRSFRDEQLTGLGGELNVIFSSMGGEIRYVGRLLVEIPRHVTKGKKYRFTVENARESTMEQISPQHAILTKDVVDAPMERRTEEPSSQ